MTNMTLAVDEQTLMKAKKVALEKHTSVSALVRDFLCQLADSEESAVRAAVSELASMFNQHKLQVGQRSWTREELHAR